MLGPLEVDVNGAAVPVAGGRLRRLLILLALEPGRLVSSARLVDGIWGEEPPAGATNALQALVSRLRRAAPRLTVESHPVGYRLVIEPDEVDVVRFERLVAEGRSAGDPATAAHLLREALGLWRGSPLLDVADAEFFQAPVARLAELRLGAVEDRVDADLRLGRGAGLVTELTSLVAEYPLRERLVGALMRALSSAGRPAEALTVYERAREALADELGTDPSPELSALHTAALRGELNPMSTVDGPKTNLRAGLTSFIGRDEDVTRVGKLLGEYRLVTLTGPGGSGKTRLAVEAASAMRDQLTDGVWLVELAPATDGADVAQAVSSAIGLRDQTLPGLAQAGEPADRLISALRNRSALLVLDNCEHVIEAAAMLAERLLGECPRLRILATSREPLGITGEALWPVEPLALPPANAGLVEAMSYASVRLLVDRAAAARPGFEVTADVVRICRALDGMPLAIELAAARLRTMSPAQLAGRLDDRFRLLTSGARTALPRHQTLRAMVDWSWELLSEDERALLRRLALFSGGATAEAAERVCGADQALLDSLTDKSLLVTTGDGRYRMLETIKAYGLERLDEAGEREKIRVAHAAYFAELAETAEPHLRRAEQLVWLDRLNADHDNITAALRGAVAAGDSHGAVRLVAAAGWYWWLAGYRTEGAELVTEALAVPGAVEDEALAVAYAMAVLFATSGLGDEREVGEYLRKVQRLTAGRNDFSNTLLRFLRAMDELLRASANGTEPKVEVLDPVLVDEDPWLRAQARIYRARLLVNLGGRQAEARADIETALAEYRVIGERWGISFALTVLADLLAQSGDLAAAHAHYGEAIAVVTEVGTTEDVLPMRAKQAQLRWLLGDPAGSAAAMAEAEREARRVNWPDGVAGMAHIKAELARWQGEPAVAQAELARAEAMVRHIVVHPVVTAMLHESRAYLEDDPDIARAHHAEALDLALASRHAPTIALVLVGIADLALRQGKPDEAAALFAASVAVRGGPDLANLDAIRVENAARAALGEEFAGAAQRGRDVTLETVRDIASVTLDG
jgi:predicted ATPase/DNA-binding SARP family transcriptional activator